MQRRRGMIKGCINQEPLYSVYFSPFVPALCRRLHVREKETSHPPVRGKVHLRRTPHSSPLPACLDESLPSNTHNPTGQENKRRWTGGGLERNHMRERLSREKQRGRHGDSPASHLANLNLLSLSHTLSPSVDPSIPPLSHKHAG